MVWNKFAFALLMALVYGLQKFLADGSFSGLDVVATVGILAAAAAAGLATNTPWRPTLKVWMAGLVAGTDVLIVQLADGWQTNLDLWPTLIALLQVVGVGLIPNIGYEPLRDTKYYRPSLRAA
jgi:hypothetical protein